MNLKVLYRHFRSWQQNPVHYNVMTDKHVCANCGHEYEGRFCPICGQYFNTGRVTWKSVGLEVFRAWGIDSRSFIASIIQILGRPGYLIGDYLNGRRQVCYSPISMLFVVAMIVMLIMHIIGFNIVPDVQSEDFGNEIINKIIVWLWSNLGWCMLSETILFIIPTWLLFRYSPKNSHHSIPEGIYIQIFMGTPVLIFSMAAEAYSKIIWFFPIYYFFAYRQLFGYSIGGTLWRSVMVLYEGFSLALILLAIPISIFVDDIFEDNEAIILFIVLMILIIAFNIGILYFGYRVGKKQSEKQSSSQTFSNK